MLSLCNGISATQDFHSMQASTLTTGNEYFSIGSLASNSTEAIVSWLLHLVRAQPKFAKHRDIGHLPLVIASLLPSRHDCLPLSLKLCHAALIVLCPLAWCKSFPSLPQTFQLSLVLRFCSAWLHQTVFHHIEDKRLANLWGQASSNSFAPKCAGLADLGPVRHPIVLQRRRVFQASHATRPLPDSTPSLKQELGLSTWDLGPQWLEGSGVIMGSPCDTLTFKAVLDGIT